MVRLSFADDPCAPVSPSSDHIEMLANGDTGEILFFRTRDDLWYPTLKLLHQCEYRHAANTGMLRVQARCEYGRAVSTGAL